MATGDTRAKRKRAEETLRESEERFRSAFEHAAIGMALVRPDGRLYQVNPSFCQMLGYSEQELLATTWQALTHPDDIGVGADQVRRILGGESDSCQFEKRYHHKLGHAIWVVLSFSLVRDAEGNPLHFISQIQDITERKRAEDELRESEGRFRGILDGMLEEACAIICFDWRYLYVNDALARQGRRTKEEHLGHTMMEMYPGIEETEAFPHLRRCMEERIPQRLENEHTFPDGAKAWFILSIQPVPEGIFTLSLNITDRKRAEEQLQRAREELEGKVERQMLRRNPYGLTFRELTVLHLVAAGGSDKQIGAELSISPLTAQKHVSNILAKMEAASRTEATARALRERLLE